MKNSMNFFLYITFVILSIFIVNYGIYNMKNFIMSTVISFLSFGIVELLILIFKNVKKQ